VVFLVVMFYLYIEKVIEKVQRRFTKRLRGFNNLSYGSRLARLGLCTLELRRLHFDLILCYKIVFGLVHVNCDVFLPLHALAM